VTVATDLGLPGSTPRGWLKLTERELREEVLKLRRRVRNSRRRYRKRSSLRYS
jgi:hypothetical protein